MVIAEAQIENGNVSVELPIIPCIIGQSNMSKVKGRKYILPLRCQDKSAVWL